jgi:hypothetical protein
VQEAAMPRWFAYLTPTPTWVRLALVPVLAFIALAVDRQYLLDFWHHLARGRAMVEQGRLVDRDLFTYTVAGQRFQDVNWLSQLGYYALYQAGGLTLVQTINALIVALTLLLLVTLCRRKSGSLGLAVAVGVFTFFGLWQLLAIRPQTFSLFLFVLLYDLLDRAENNRRWLLLPPFLLALWTNLHGAFPAGLMLLGCFLLASAWRAWRGGGLLRDRLTLALGLCLSASILATLVNPYGWGIYLYVGQTSSRAASRGIVEWLPPRLDMLVGMVWAVSLGLLLLLLALAWRLRGRRPNAREAFLIACFLPLACGSVRMVAWWLIVFAPLAASWLAALLPTRSATEARPSWAAGLTFALLLLLAGLSVPGMERFNPLLGFAPRRRQTEAGLEAVHRYLAERPEGGRLFSRFEWGEYLSWSCAPHCRVFLDGRIEIYPDDVWNQYLCLTFGKKGWQEVLDKHRVNYLVLDADYHGDNGLLAQVEKSPGWRRTLKAEGGVVLFERRSTLASREQCLASRVASAPGGHFSGR